MDLVVQIASAHLYESDGGGAFNTEDTSSQAASGVKTNALGVQPQGPPSPPSPWQRERHGAAGCGSALPAARAPDTVGGAVDQVSKVEHHRLK